MADPIRVLVTDPLSEEGMKLLTVTSQITVDVRPKLAPDQLIGLIGGYDALIVRSATHVTREVVLAANKLKVIGRAGAGLDNIDVEAASKKGIIVMNAAGGNTVSTAEHTMSLLLSLARNIPQATGSLKSGQWNRTKFVGVELSGKYLGIVGLGRIGSEVAKRALAFGMRILVYDPYLSQEKIQELDAHPVKELGELLSQADFITFHTPLSDETRHLIGAAEFARMKNGVRLVNCARGGIIDEKALAEAIRSGHVAGAALDVFEQEPPTNQELLSLPQVVVTPHLGASTEEAQRSVATDIAVCVRDFLLGRGVRNAVNFPSVDPEVLALIDPYLRLVEKMGLMQAQMAEGSAQEVRVRYVGEITRLPLTPVTVAFIKGLLTPALQETVNYVNAGVLAKERGIKVIESKATEAQDFANLITTVVETDRGQTEIHGTLFTRTDPRIVRINDFYMDAVPDGSVLVIRNLDKPGMIGRVGSTLGARGINIGWMTFGRKAQGGEAMTVLNVDQPVSPSVLEELKKLPDVLDVKLIKLHESCKPPRSP